jgi:hypothetical protein
VRRANTALSGVSKAPDGGEISDNCLINAKKIKKRGNNPKMSIRQMLPILFFFMTILLVVLMAPQVQSANTAAFATFNASTEKASMIGLSVIMPWGDILIIISILTSTGLLSMRIGGGNIGLSDVMKPIFLIIIAIFALNFYDSIITAFNTLIAGTANAGAQIFWGLILLLIYLGIIGVAGGYEGYQAAKDRFGKGKAKAATGGAVTPL